MQFSLNNLLRTALGLFLFGAMVGNVYNSFHAFSGTLPVTEVHIHPLLDWTSYLLFGFAGLSIGYTNLLLDKFSGRSVSSVSLRSAAGAIALLGIFYFLSACLFLGNAIIFLLLAVGFIISCILYYRSYAQLIAALLVATAGTSLEIYFVHSGMYYYARPQFMGVAYWLPLLYGIASINTGQLARAFILI